MPLANSVVHEACCGRRTGPSRPRRSLGEATVRFFGWSLEEKCPRCPSLLAPQRGNRKAQHVEIVLRARPSWPSGETTVGLHLRAPKNDRPVCEFLVAPRGGDHKTLHVGSEGHRPVCVFLLVPQRGNRKTLHVGSDVLSTWGVSCMHVLVGFSGR